MSYKNKPMNAKHFLAIGSKGYIYHTKYALDNGIEISLLIDKDKYKPEFDKLFTSVFIVDDVFNFEQVKAVLKNKKIDVVFTRFEDYIAVVGVLNEYLGLDGIDYKTSRNFGNKHKMKNKFLEKNVPCAQGVCADKKENIKNFIKKYNFPLILKKTSGTHSSFVYKVKSKLDLDEKLTLFLTQGQSYKISKTVDKFISSKNIDNNNDEAKNKECDLLLEEMLDGREVTIDTFVSNGEFIHTPICEYVMPEELGIDDSYLPIRSIPTNLPEDVEAQLFKTTQDALKALGANNCVCHTELFYNKNENKSWIIETSPRGGGNRSLMINQTTDTDYDKSILIASSGGKVEKFVQNGKTLSVIEYFSEIDGTIKKIDLSFINDIPEARISKILLKVGDKAKPAYAGGKSIVAIIVEENSIDRNRKISIIVFNKLREMIIVE